MGRLLELVQLLEEEGGGPLSEGETLPRRPLSAVRTGRLPLPPPRPGSCLTSRSPRSPRSPGCRLSLLHLRGEDGLQLPGKLAPLPALSAPHLHSPGGKLGGETEETAGLRLLPPLPPPLD